MTFNKFAVEDCGSQQCKKGKLGAWKLFKYKQMTTKQPGKYNLEIVNKSDLGLRQAKNCISSFIPVLTKMALPSNTSKSFILVFD